jgi:NAD(P)-dependent dehydrogenase (short-subunit alcohol dehydrogenase family)
MAVDFGLQGQVAIVTGSTSGIGHAMADALAAQGVNIVLNGLGEMTAIEKTRAEMAEKAWRRGALQRRRHDQARPDRRDGQAAAKAEFGELDILVNNAGVQHVAPIEDFPVDQWDLIIAINLSSAFHATARRADHEGAGARADRQHRLGPRPGRLAVQGRLRRRQARHPGPDQDRRPGDWPPSASPATPSARAS